MASSSSAPRFSGPTADRLKPKIGETAKVLWIIYLVIAASMILLIFCGGMPIFDTICHTFATVLTAGFSSKNMSVVHYNNLYIEIVFASFMFICGCNFSLYYMCFQKEFKKVLKNSELRFFASLVLIAIIFVALSLYFNRSESFNGGIKDYRYYNLGNSFRYAIF